MFMLKSALARPTTSNATLKMTQMFQFLCDLAPSLHYVLLRWLPVLLENIFIIPWKIFVQNVWFLVNKENLVNFI